jgi:hypothetical protein
MRPGEPRRLGILRRIPVFDRSFALSALLLATSVGQTDPTAAKQTLARYFPAQVGMSWTYERLAPTASGSTEEKYVECVAVGTCDGERTATMRQVYFLGPEKLVTSIVYAYSTSSRKLYENESYNDLTGARRDFDRPVVIWMPTSSDSVTWSRDDKDEDGRVGCVIEYSARFVPVCSTALRTYRNVLMVTERTYCNAGTQSARRAVLLGLIPEGLSKKVSGRALLSLRRSYFALDVGLVKCLAFGRDGILCGPVSSQLTQFSGR